MGEDVEARTFTREDRTRYRQKVRRCLDVFARMLRESRFDTDAADDRPGDRAQPGRRARRPGDAQRRGARRDRQPGLPDRAGPVQHRDQRAAARRWPATALAEFEDQLRAEPERAPSTAARGIGAHMVMIGILPTLQPDHLNARHAVGQPALPAAQRADLRGPRRGPAARRSTAPDRLRATADSIAPEAACTSVQFHLQVAPGAVRRLLERRPGDRRRAGGASARTRRSCSASELWRETRIALFEQATDTRSEELKAQGVRPRVWFGERWITSIFDLFEENVRYFPALLPICDDEDPVEVLDRGDTPQLARAAAAQRHGLPLEPAGLRRRRRPAAPAGGEPGAAGRPDGRRHDRQRRVLLRPGPGAGRGRAAGVDADVVRRGRGELPRRRPARHRRARCSGRAAGEVPATELVLRRLLPLAARGPGPLGRRRRRAGPAAGHHRAALPHRAQRRGAGRSTTVHAAGADSADLDPAPTRCAAMALRYAEHMHTNEPVHTWPVEG